MLWWLADDPGLSATAREALAEPANDVLVSTASVWEIAIKRALGKLGAPDDLPGHIEAAGFGWLPVTAEHAWQVRSSRRTTATLRSVLVAQSLVEQMPIVSADPRFAAYGVEVRW